MAEYSLIPKTSPDTTLSDERKALLFLCSQLLNDQKPDATPKERYDSLSHRALQIPCFVLDRTQNFDHKANNSGEKCYNFQDQFMMEEINLFLPPSLKQVDLLQQDVEIALKQDSLTVTPKEHGAAIESGDDTDRECSETKEGEDKIIRECRTYLKCYAIPTNLGCNGKCLETCFVYLPSWNDFQFELHYVNVRVSPVKPQSGFISTMINRRQEKIELVGTRSIMKFSILMPTAIEAVKLLESKGKPVSDEATKFLTLANKFSIVPVKALDDEIESPKADSDEQGDQETSEDKLPALDEDAMMQ